jgi:membrane glycosyltransferase
VLERSTPEIEKSTRAGNAITGRRMLFAGLVTATMAALLWLMATVLSAGNFGIVKIAILALFAMTLPWTVIGFWNATIGYLIMHFAADPIAAVIPVAASIRGDEKVTASTAILLCIRNELPERLVRNLEPMMGELVAAGIADRFHVYILSDTDDAEIAVQEGAHFGALASRWNGRIALAYRKRAINTGFKAGNIRDFCEHHGGHHDFALILDADSFMTAEGILRLVRIMQADANLGILQSLVVGLPSTSAFARIFQFGMRLGMRSYTIGSAWWQGDCGPYWGHNAVLRLAPFIAHCRLPVLPKKAMVGGHVLSHDQIEAALMRRAGYEVRVLPEEGFSWEENPPSLIEFIRRDLRWCQGNMQYWHFLDLPGLKLVSRCQLAFAILMFLGSPAWIGMLIIGTLALALTPTATQFIRPDRGMALLIVILVMWFAPKIATAANVLARSDLRRAFGGTARFLASVVTETIFFILLSPIMWVGHTMFLAGLPFGRTIGWIGQARNNHSVSVAMALRSLCVHTALGCGVIALLTATHPAAIPYALLLAGGLVLAIPFAVITAWPAVGTTLARIGVGRLPEETAPLPALCALELPAIAAATSISRLHPA